MPVCYFNDVQAFVKSELTMALSARCDPTRTGAPTDWKAHAGTVTACASRSSGLLAIARSLLWAARTRGFSGEMIRDMLVVAVEKRLCAYRAPQKVECVRGNGSIWKILQKHPNELSPELPIKSLKIE